jgi:erythromycin esterase-like protein
VTSSRRLAAACLLLVASGGAEPVAASVADPGATGAAATADAAPARRPPTGGFPIAPGVFRLDGFAPDLGSTEDLAPLRQMIGKAEVVGLGETYHTTGGFYDLKHRIFRYLVETLGFRALGFESNWTPLDQYAAAYVDSCAGDSNTAQTGHWGVFYSEELGNLLEWMCEWNQAHPEDKVVYFGFDIQQPQLDGPNLVAFLERIGIAADHRWIAAIRGCDGVTVTYPFGQVPADAHNACIGALREIDSHFQTNKKAIAAQTSQRELTVATLQLVGLRGNENQSWIFPHSFPNGITARDEAMAYAFLTQRALHAPRAKTVVWAANIHVARAVHPNRAKPMGSFLNAALGAKYVAFALAAYETEVDPPAPGCGLREPPAGGVEEILHAAWDGSFLVDLSTERTRLRPGRRYGMGVDVVEPHKGYNGIVFLEHAPRMQPLGWPPC